MLLLLFFIIVIIIIFARLVENGCPVNAQNLSGDTAMHLGVTVRAHRDVLKGLLLKGADCGGLRNEKGQTVMELVLLLTKENEGDRYYLSLCEMLSSHASRLEKQELFFLFQVVIVIIVVRLKLFFMCCYYCYNYYSYFSSRTANPT
jgi:hypothetical protein